MGQANPANGRVPWEMCSMRMTIVPLNGVDAQLIQATVQRLKDILPWEYEIAPRCGDPEEAAGTVALNVADLFERLHRSHQPNQLTIGVTSCDLVAPGLDYVFGYAAPAQAAGIISLARLSNTGGDQRILAERAAKEILHETGHLLGLGHCGDPACVMTYSQTLQDTDNKSCSYCRRCVRELSRLPEIIAEG